MGKGGVGKTTVCALLGHTLSSNKRILLVELDGNKQHGRIFSKDTKYEHTDFNKDLSGLSITPEEAIKEYILKILRSKRLYSLLFENKIINPLLQSAPGLHEAVQLGKIYDLSISGQWDCIIVDTPSTGHGIKIIEAAHGLMRLTKVGPMYSTNKDVDEYMQENSGILIVTLLEDLPYKESLELIKALKNRWKKNIMGVVANQNFFNADDDSPIETPQKTLPQALRIYLERKRIQREYWNRLKSNLSIPILNLNIISTKPCEDWKNKGQSILQALED